jgi:hypothetical protein
MNVSGSQAPKARPFELKCFGFAWKLVEWRRFFSYPFLDEPYVFIRYREPRCRTEWSFNLCRAAALSVSDGGAGGWQRACEAKDS